MAEIFCLGMFCLSIASFSSPKTVAGVRACCAEESFSAISSAFGLSRAYSTHAWASKTTAFKVCLMFFCGGCEGFFNVFIPVCVFPFKMECCSFKYAPNFFDGFFNSRDDYDISFFSLNFLKFFLRDYYS